jgi:hypothetical protein
MADQPLDLSCPPRYWADGINKPAVLTVTNDMPTASEFSKLSVNIPVNVSPAKNGSTVRRFSNCSDNVDSLTSDRSPSLSPSSAISGRGGVDSGSESPIIGGSEARLHTTRRRVGDSESSGSHSDYESGEGSPSPPKGMCLTADVLPSAASPPLASTGPATKRFLSKYIEEHKGTLFLYNYI